MVKDVKAGLGLNLPHFVSKEGAFLQSKETAGAPGIAYPGVDRFLLTNKVEQNQVVPFYFHVWIDGCIP